FLLAMGMLLLRYVIAQSKTQNVTGASNQLPVDQGVPITRPNNDHAVGLPAGRGNVAPLDGRGHRGGPVRGASPARCHACRSPGTATRRLASGMFSGTRSSFQRARR